MIWMWTGKRTTATGAPEAFAARVERLEHPADLLPRLLIPAEAEVEVGVVDLEVEAVARREHVAERRSAPPGTSRATPGQSRREASF